MGNLRYMSGMRNKKMQQLDESNKHFQESIDYYESSLRLNSKDDDTRYNLAMAQYMLEKNRKEQNNQNQNKDQNQNNQSQNQNQKENKDQQNDSKDKDDQKAAFIVVECKAENVKIRVEDYYQGFNYAAWAHADFFVTTNEKETKFFTVDPAFLPQKRGVARRFRRVAPRDALGRHPRCARALSLR